MSLQELKGLDVLIITNNLFIFLSCWHHFLPVEKICKVVSISFYESKLS